MKNMHKRQIIYMQKNIQKFADARYGNKQNYTIFRNLCKYEKFMQNYAISENMQKKVQKYTQKFRNMHYMLKYE